ncbi:geranylgeranyl reductase family protein [Corynebacterium choanae]|uniref:Oxidoreductase n=1 Tax=Corynebacterium choanae TaxID=1862358 RepID=A0A3G6J9K2_9CORY|nr:geranylgeranyl reductase family protein [Corynebacterium choanae]AZA14452.1 Putative oxidoreductase [Corynebacterium choanae]
MWQADVVIVGFGPAGAAAAIAASRAGLSVIAVERGEYGRDKTCGDGLTPRAMTQLAHLGLGESIGDGYRNYGLKLHGFGGDVTVAWPDTGQFRAVGSAMRRTRLDALLADLAAAQPGVTVHYGTTVKDVTVVDGTLVAVSCIASDAGDHAPITVRGSRFIIADGVRSTVGKLLGRQWHQQEVYGIAARGYAQTPCADEPWIHSHVELSDEFGTTQPGYGWIFPLGASDGCVNVGCGALSIATRKATVNTKQLLRHYHQQVAADFLLQPVTQVTSALLPMGGAVSNVAGANWMLIGDAAACVNPLNGEGIDYGLETAQLAIDLATSTSGPLTYAWPALLRDTYGDAFAIARRAARLLCYPELLPAVGPMGMRGRQAQLVMPIAARLMGNLVSAADRDVTSWLWRRSGRLVRLATADRQLWSVDPGSARS